MNMQTPDTASSVTEDDRAPLVMKKITAASRHRRKPWPTRQKPANAIVKSVSDNPAQ